MKKDYGLTMRGIIRNENNEILILKRHPKSRTDPNTWELPGGKVEAGEFFDDALIREIKEETNLDCEIGDLAIAIQHDYSFKTGGTVIQSLFVFLCDLTLCYLQRQRLLCCFIVLKIGYCLQTHT